jgi:SAM-dependent methyltransferase
MKDETLALFYKHYSDWKGWVGKSDAQDGIYRKEVRRAGIKSHSKILELGFGDGGFLKWCKQNNYDAVGIEKSSELVTRAQNHGYNVHCLGDDELLGKYEGKFDAIVAFDVLEHMSVEESIAFMGNAKRFLKSSGIIIFRVPNCASPYGMVYQKGDFTHVTEWSEQRFRHFSYICGFSCVNVYAAATSARGGRFFLLRGFVFFLRDLHSLIISYLYFGKKLIFSPAITAVFAPL